MATALQAFASRLFGPKKPKPPKAMEMPAWAARKAAQAKAEARRQAAAARHAN